MALDHRPTVPVLSVHDVEGLIADGHYIFILNQNVIKADAWLPYHPGGQMVIQHMVGRDATDEVTAYHSLETLQQMMSRYRIGRIEGRWKNFLPPIQGGIFRRRGLDSAGAEAKAMASELHCGDKDRAVSDERSPSTLSDSEATKHLRNRHEGSSSGSTTPSSASGQEEEALGGMAHLDVLTKLEIKLDMEKYPALDHATQDSICQQYRALGERIKEEGLYKCNYRAYAIECVRYTLLITLCLVFLRWRWYATSAVFLGLWWHQLTFTAHDAGHLGITHNFNIDSTIAVFVADFLAGLSMGWWKKSHNVHHLVTNLPEHDPDIEQMPFFAVSHRLLESLTSTYYNRVMEYDAAAKMLVRIQHKTYYFLLLFGRFNLYRLSWEYLLFSQGPRKGPAAWLKWLEYTGLVCFWFWFGYLMVYRSIDSGWARLYFVIISHFVSAPVHLQIVLSHFAMSTADLGVDESFPQKQLRTTMDVDCPEWLDFIHGGLQFQAVHHLFPRIPRHNLRRTQKLVQEFCNDVGIPYALYGFVHGNERVIGRLTDVARQAAILAKCQAYLAEGGDHH